MIGAVQRDVCQRVGVKKTDKAFGRQANGAVIVTMPMQPTLAHSLRKSIRERGRATQGIGLMLK